MTTGITIAFTIQTFVGKAMSLLLNTQYKFVIASLPRSKWLLISWHLNNEEGWVPKNWCFWIVVLEKTLENPLDCKEIKAVNPKENQFWIFIGRTDAEAPILWPIYTHICVPSLSVMSYSVWPHRVIHSHKKEWNLPLQQHGWTWMVLCLVKQDSSVQSLSRVQLFATPWTAARQASWSITNSRSLLKLMSIESVMPSNHLILCHPLLQPPSIFPSIRVFLNESVLRIRWPKYWSFSFNISSANEYSGLISFRRDWLDLLAVQETLKILLQHHSLKESILQCSAFFIVQLSYLHMTTGKTITLTRWTFVGKVMSLLFNMLSRLVITFLPRSKRLLISCLH